MHTHFLQKTKVASNSGPASISLEICVGHLQLASLRLWGLAEKPCSILLDSQSAKTLQKTAFFKCCSILLDSPRFSVGPKVAISTLLVRIADLLRDSCFFGGFGEFWRFSRFLCQR
jgi:hypothetical protein